MEKEEIDNTPTPHNSGRKGDFAKVCLMPGDPLRAKFIAENFLENPVQVNGVRGMLGYTGTYKGIKISVMGSGMGMPSIGIYATELFKFYGVEKIIRVGSCGGYDPELKVFNTLIVQSASTNSSWAKQYELPGDYSATPDFQTMIDAYETAKKLGIPTKAADVLSEDNFYNDVNPEGWKKWTSMGISACEMESFALFCIAKHLHKKALTILTVSDSVINHVYTTAEERQTSFKNMMQLALETALVGELRDSK